MSVTGVMLHWKRSENTRNILEGWYHSGLVDSAIVWNNNPDVTFTHPWAKVINSSSDMGLYSRFAAACLAPTDCVLIQDDDLLVPTESLLALLNAWRSAPMILHGIFGRRPKEDGTYAQFVHGNTAVPIVLTRVLVTSRAYAADFFQYSPRFDELQRDSCPYGNGEDIILSYVAQLRSGHLNQIHQLPYTELPAPAAIHKRADSGGHWRHRTSIMLACQQMLNELS